MTKTPDRYKALERVEQLINLMNNPNPHEAKAARDKAMELVAKHDLKIKVPDLKPRPEWQALVMVDTGVPVVTTDTAGPWTRFMDMHSGGSTKLEPWDRIYIQAPEKEAEIIFQNRFGRNPNRITCTCCGEDYSISEGEDLYQVTAYDRDCDYDNETHRYLEKSPGKSYSRYQPLVTYLADKDVHFVFARDIKPEERVGELREEGFVWRG